MSPAPSNEVRNPYVGGEEPRRGRWFSLPGGVVFTVVVLLFLAWIQPVSNGNARVDLPPTFAFQVEPGPPKQTRRPEREQRNPPKKQVRETKPKKAMAKRSSTPARSRNLSNRAARSGNLRGVGTNVSITAGLGAGGGPALNVGDEFGAIADEVLELIEYRETQERIRNYKGQRDALNESRRPKGIARGAQRINDPDPPYPDRARQKGIEGVVQFRALVGTDGTIEEYEIIACSHPGYFEETIDELVIPRMKFRPAQDEEGRPLPSWEVINYRFQLKD